jgi:hypothetical protein
VISEHSDHDAMAARLAIIEAEPLEDRATGYAQLHEELRERLEGADAEGRPASAHPAGEVHS